MSTADSVDSGDLAALVARLGVNISTEMLVLSLTHRSFAHERGGIPTNERLEFLGDSVLGLVVTDYLYRTFPDLPEGQLAKMRSAVVNARACAEVATLLEIGPVLRLGRGEEATGGRAKTSILADAMEAIIGAVYLDAGRDAAAEFVHRLFNDRIHDAAKLGAGLDWKTSLQELTAALGLGPPSYLITEDGPDHAKHFRATVKLIDGEYGYGSGRTKKIAEQGAAETAYQAVQEKHAVVE